MNEQYQIKISQNNFESEIIIDLMALYRYLDTTITPDLSMVSDIKKNKILDVSQPFLYPLIQYSEKKEQRLSKTLNSKLIVNDSYNPYSQNQTKRLDEIKVKYIGRSNK